MMFSTESSTDLRERSFGHLLGNIHSDLARKGDFRRIILRFQLGYIDLELMTDGFLDLFDCDDRHG